MRRYKQYYCWIKDISKLLSLQASKDGHVCFRCLNTVKTEKSLASYHEYCKSPKAIEIELPKEGTKIYFKNHDRSRRVSFIVYADFESFTSQLSTCQPNPDKSHTKRYQKHSPADFVAIWSVLMTHSILKNQLLL